MSGFSAKAVASAPGKAILFGEHAVVYGVTAIAVSLSDLRIQADLAVESDGSGVMRVIFDDLTDDSGNVVVGTASLDRLASLINTSDSTPTDAVNPPTDLQAVLQAEFAHYPSAACQGMMASTYIFVHVVLSCLLRRGHKLADLGVTLQMRSMGLPIGAGLGSSAAFAVAAAGACVQLLQKVSGSELPGLGADEHGTLTAETKRVINSWAFAGEVLIHGLPSGLDNTTSCYGGLVKFTKKDGSNDFDVLAHGPELDILLTNTRVPRSTRVLVAGVRQLRDTFPAVMGPLFDSIQAITDTFLLKISDGQDISESDLASLVNMNHHLLNAIGVGHRALDEVAEASAEAGFACKLTGAGGGGCAITILTTQADRSAKIDAFTQKLSAKEFQVLQTKIGGQGVRWH